MRALLVTVTAVVAPLPLSAQPDHFTSSPVGYTWTEGESALSLLGSNATVRYQQIDSTNGGMPDRNRIAFRRDNTLPVGVNYTARTVEVEVLFAESDLGAMSTNFECNYKANASVVFARKLVNFPDWTLPSPTSPAPHDLQIPLDNRWSYAGKAVTGNDFLWEVRIWSNTAAGQPYPFDFALPNASATVAAIRGHEELGVGCRASGHPEPSHLETFFINTRSQIIMDVEIVASAKNQPHILLMSLLQQTISLSSMCTLFHPGRPMFTLPLGTTDNEGHLEACLRFPFRSAGGLAPILQAVAADPTQQSPFMPLTLTQGNRTTIPGFPAGPRATVGYMYTTEDEDHWHHADFGPLPGGIILMTNHP